MSKRRVQVSSDRGSTWKFRWVDPFEFDPSKSSLKPGDWVRKGPDSDLVIVILLKDGKLYSVPIDQIREYTFTLASGESYVILAESPEDANRQFVNALVQDNMLVLTSSSLTSKDIDR